ncbi:uncharacterized protein HMPREF1541_00384 [Cyphellophora europaea CBS 101466]|uniref:DUF427 domain-containing protein n=1 Tax=Cyphellophora europaea (strain CBS 101466) TaxID=1220924 RepID=W2SC64_CYPE1|nr:uncharacterized protein HMPREF1541_00384 [Cyphellophora europaea CBS 101466]ETN46200.1 hypothetical protein HMPREF1541_00384 [Cyphellophora europaea CBS 101466]
MSTKAKLNVHDFPRPPLLEKTSRHLVIKWNNEIVADTKDAYWALETTHPPTYYIPPTVIPTATFTLTPIPNKSSLCEWKGRATYWNLTHNNHKSSDNASNSVSNRIWSYEEPTPGFRAIKGYLSFYASGVPWECFVDGERVQPQDGDFYGGWVTSELEGPMKGGAGTWGW